MIGNESGGGGGGDTFVCEEMSERRGGKLSFSHFCTNPTIIGRGVAKHVRTEFSDYGGQCLVSISLKPGGAQRPTGIDKETIDGENIHTHRKK